MLLLSIRKFVKEGDEQDDLVGRIRLLLITNKQGILMINYYDIISLNVS